ncbi:aldo/keto reductase [Fictibacillus nanhaiensis]|uniref:aldo/keto reductase n=1 Tax=Fictibacillus nanhaiensis TaxID=742169 RepID=UPI002E225F90|nr:aldo/keto reductase [Fictibacillus nanhaiensis]
MQISEVSRIAIGTHLGEMNEEDSLSYQGSIEFSLLNGINFIDTALNYRGMRSERDVGSVLEKLIQKEKQIHREDVFLSTKAGIIPGDIDAQLRPNNYLQEILVDKEIIQRSDLQILDHHKHVMEPSFYEFAIQQSLKHMHVDYIDVHYIHNPEVSLIVLGEEAFYQKLKNLFSFYEQQVEEGLIRYYGLAVWSAFTESPGASGYLPLEKVMNVAHSVAGNAHHLRFIQAPFNHSNQIAATDVNQLVNGNWRTLLQAAEELGIHVTTSAPLDCGRLTNHQYGHVDELISFVLKTPGILSTMIGMRKVETVKKNLKLFNKVGS